MEWHTIKKDLLLKSGDDLCVHDIYINNKLAEISITINNPIHIDRIRIYCDYANRRLAEVTSRLHGYDHCWECDNNALVCVRLINKLRE